jgi:hypothetical protein
VTEPLEGTSTATNLPKALVKMASALVLAVNVVQAHDELAVVPVALVEVVTVIAAPA